MGLGIKTRLQRWPAGRASTTSTSRRACSARCCARRRARCWTPPAEGAALHVAFVVPFFQQGSGGHMTIANLVRALERRGHRCSLWIDDPGGRCGGGAERRGRATCARGSGRSTASVAYGLEAFAGADVAVATGWQTVARVLTLPAAGRAYLVQDHEPEFFGTSVQRAWAAGHLPPRPVPDHRGPVAGRHDGRVVRVARHVVRPRHRRRALPAVAGGGAARRTWSSPTRGRRRRGAACPSRWRRSPSCIAGGRRSRRGSSATAARPGSTSPTRTSAWCPSPSCRRSTPRRRSAWCCR